MALKNRSEETFKFDINTSILDLMLCYCFSSNENISMGALGNLYQFIKAVDTKEYKNNYEVDIRLRLLKLTLDAICEKRIREVEMVRSYVYMNIGNEVEQEDAKILFGAVDDSDEMCNADIEYINSYVAQRLTHTYLYKYQNDLNECIQMLQTGSSSIHAINTKFEEVITKLYSSIRTTKAAGSANSYEFSFRDEDSLDAIVDKTITNLNKPSNFLSTGIKRLNAMLGGGWQASRTYVAMGMQKGFKSAFLLNAAIWAVKYNPNIEPKDPTKKPCVVYLTMENDVEETLGRIYHYCTGGNIKDSTVAEAKHLLIKELSVEGSEVDLEIWYRPNMSINTMDADALLDDMANRGKECVFFIQDYLERIRATDRSGDLRLDLGTVVNEFTVISKDRKIPILTAAQLNREAMRVFDDYKATNKNDVAKKLGNANVGESINIIKNCDYALIVNKEYTSKGTSYLTFKPLVSRYCEITDPYFAQPFATGNGLRLREDVKSAKSESIDSISDIVNELDLGDKVPINSRTGGASRFKTPTTNKTNEFFNKKAGNLSEADFDDI